MSLRQYREVLSSNLFHISSEQFIAQLIKFAFKHVGKLFEKSVGTNTSRYGKISLLEVSASPYQTFFGDNLYTSFV
jgi:hypothetical protein